MEIQVSDGNGTCLLPSAYSQGSEETGQQLQMSAFIINEGADPRLSETYQQAQS